MDYLYGTFSDNQIQELAKQMHNDVHKLLLYMDPAVENKTFGSNEEFKRFFRNTLLRFGGLNTLLCEPGRMPYFMGALQAAFDELDRTPFSFPRYRKLILDAHGYLTEIFKEVR